MTAIEWLVNELKDNGLDYIDYAEDIIKKAKEMEKQQNENEFERGFLKCADTLQFILDKGLLNNYNNQNVNLKTNRKLLLK